MINGTLTHKKTGFTVKIISIEQEEFTTTIKGVLKGKEMFDVVTIEIPSINYEQWKIESK